MRTTVRRAVCVALAVSATLGAQVKLPPFTREVLPNGALVLLMPKAGVPLVHFRILVKGGVESDPSGMGGLSGVTAMLLRKGTAARSAAQFSQELDYLGGTFNSGLDSQPYGSAASVDAEFLSKDFDRGLDLISDAILKPTFPEAEVRKELARLSDGIRSMKDNPQAALMNYFRPAFFGPQHPYGNPASEASLGRIHRKDVVDYHARQYCGRNLIVVVTGEIDPAAAKTKIAKTFGTVSAGETWKWAPRQEVARAGRLTLIDKADATQTYFVIAQPGIDRAHPDRIPLEIVNTLFGGRFTSMLNDELRVDTGLTYGARSNVDEPRLPGAIAISTYTKTETTVRAMDLALEILKRLGEKGITAEQLESAKAYIKGQYPTRNLETIDQLAARLAEVELYGVGRDDVDRFYARINAVTLDQANAAARRYYRGDNLSFVVLGPAAKIRDAVKKYSPTLVELSVKDPGWDRVAATAVR